MLETLSVILQVGSFRIFKRRIFRMAPIHHHFELGGWPETTVIIRFWILAGLCTALALGLYYADFIAHGRRSIDPSTSCSASASPATPCSARLVARGEARGGRRRPARPTPGRALADELGVELVEAPDADASRALVARSRRGRSRARACPTTTRCSRPPRPRRCRCSREFDLAARWDDRPHRRHHRHQRQDHGHRRSTRAMLEASGRRAVAVGNTEVPAGRRHRRPDVEVFVVEASSFRLAALAAVRARRRRRGSTSPPTTSTSTPTFDAYEAAKARIWADQDADQVAIGNADDPVVAAHLAGAPGRHVTFGLGAAPTTISTAIAWCSPTASSWPASASSAAPSRTTSPTRWPPRPARSHGRRRRATASAPRCWPSAGSPTG